jgi:hypothetical protein
MLFKIGYLHVGVIKIEKDSESVLELEDDAQFLNRIITRFSHCLRDQWACKVKGHTYCFVNLDGLHVPLTDEAILVWVNALVYFNYLALHLLTIYPGQRQSDTSESSRVHHSVKKTHRH